MGTSTLYGTSEEIGFIRKISNKSIINYANSVHKRERWDNIDRREVLTAVRSEFKRRRIFTGEGKEAIVGICRMLGLPGPGE